MQYRDQTDETLVMLTLAGDGSAYETLVTRYEKAVVASANSVIGSLYMAQDAAQDAFITAWMKLDLLREPGKYGAWVCRIAKNCAKKMIMRFRSYLPLEVVENYIADDEEKGDPLQLYVSAEEKELLHESISTLPERVREVIRLHYFEDKSISEIAELLGVSAGTVKSQLHDGRRRIRKELCAMNEKIDDTLVQRVMKKVEELKLWRLKNSKNGFEAVYSDVLSAVEDLPECTDKYHALADVLMSGWWWLPGEKNDALLARIREAAELGKNDDVMTFIVASEDEKVWGNARIAFIRDEQIPKLERLGLKKSLAHEWFWLANAYFDDNRAELGFEAYRKVMEILTSADVYYAYAKAAIAMHETVRDRLSEKNKERYHLCAITNEMRVVDGALYHWNHNWCSAGEYYGGDGQIDKIYRNSSFCDGKFTVAGASVGDVYVGSDGTTLTYEADNAVVVTPCGEFDGCELWVTKYTHPRHCGVYKTYYKRGVGIVKHIRVSDGITEERVLKSYRIAGGEGLIPLCFGNEWEYTSSHAPDVLIHNVKYSVCHADGAGAVLTGNSYTERVSYDENSWLDMIEKIRSEYCVEVDGNLVINDVYHEIERAEALAVSPLEKAHTKAAASVARRILATDEEFNPDCTEYGRWNFFSRNQTEKKDGKILVISGSFRWSFEWKALDGTPSGEPLLQNDIYDILADAAGCIWSDGWCPGASYTEERMHYGTVLQTEVRCEDAGNVTTKAGSFDGCIKVCLDIKGFKRSSGVFYRGGKKEYYYAPGIGIVRAVSECCSGTKKAVYDLTAYEGVGEGYMPLADGMMRHYDALDLTDGYAAAAEYLFVKDDEGNIVFFEDRTGVQKKLAPITQYSAILDEQIEDRLWLEEKHDESRRRYGVNNFRLLLHFLGRPSRTWAAPEMAVEWGKYRLTVMEGLSCNGEVPPAWYGGYTMSTFRVGCALCGLGRSEEGYEYIEKAFRLADKWLKFERGAMLDVGHPLIYGGVKLVKDMGVIELPDGTREIIDYDWLFDFEGTELYYALTATRGWEWFDGVRNDDRYREYVERAKKLSDSVKAK